MKIQNENTSLFKMRSYAGCIKSAFTLAADNCRALLFSLVPYALLAALCLTLYLAAYAFAVIGNIGGTPSPMAEWSALAAYLCFCASFAFFMGRTFFLFRHFKSEGCIPRLGLLTSMSDTVRIALRSIPFLFLPLVIIAPGLPIPLQLLSWLPLSQPWTVQTAIYTGLLLLLAVLVIGTLPLIYTSYIYMMDGGNLFRVLPHSYREAFRHKGKLFATTFFSVLITALLAILPLLSVILSFLAVFSNALGILSSGDPSGLHASAYILISFSTLLSLTLLLLLYAFIHLPLLYVYGSITVQEQERRVQQTAS